MKILSVKILAIIFMFVIGLLFTLTYKHNDLVEGFTFNDKCPNLLIKKGKELHLVNTKKAMIPGVNPVKFDSLEDYAQFVEYQKYLNIKCPVLYYQETYDSQNNKGYRLMSNPLDSKAGLPSNISKNYNVTNSNIPGSGMFENSDDVNPLVDASRDKKPFNQGNHHGMDPEDQNVGLKTILDKMDMDTNPMSRWWKGDAATQSSICKGDFVGRTRNLNDPFKEQKILNKA